MKYDPARWICQCRPEICNGLFYVYSEARPCPLRHKCLSSSRGHQLEYLYAQQSIYQRKLHLADPERYMAHAKRHLDLRRAFVPEEDKRLNRAHYERNKSRYAAIAARKYREAHLEQEHLKKPKYDLPLPPCGKACEEEDGCCPFDDDCHFPDWEEQQIAAIEAAKAEQRQEAQRTRNRERWACLKADPERYAAHLARERDRKRAARGALKLEKPPETPEQKEARLAAAMERRRELNRLSHAQRMTDPEYAEQYKAKQRDKSAKRWASMTSEQREANREAQRAYYHDHRAAETPEEREARLIKDRAKAAAMTPEEREAKNAKARERDRRRRENETPEQREARLAQDREARHTREAAMTPEEREVKNAKQRARYWMRKDLARKIKEEESAMKKQ